MVRPALRSRSCKRIRRRTPGSRTVTHYERRKRTLMRCARCGAILNGLPTTDHLRRNLPKTSKRPERMFGGFLCSRCLREVLKNVVRGSVLK
uniref:Large ribosomal subunit protein eL34 n=1 Tax=Ignisphaera aggregans TaxID=334771 RepID=A0A7J2TZH9_9CREN